MNVDTDCNEETVHEGQNPLEIQDILIKSETCDQPEQNNEHRSKCAICGKTFSNWSNLKRHVATVHEGQTLYECDECGKSFGSKGNLNQHVATVHEGLKSYECDECGKSFSLKGNLTKHVSAVHKYERKKDVSTVHESQKHFAVPGSFKETDGVDSNQP